MIAGVASQAGLTEDQLAQKIFPDTQPGFTDVLKAVSGSRESAASSGGAARKVLPDPRLRNNYLREQIEDRPEPREDVAGFDKESRHALTNASPAANPIQKAPDPTPPSPTKEAEAPNVPSKALQRRDGGEEKQKSEIGRPGPVAATGLTAYRLSAHGKGEEVFAELAGTIPLGETLGKGESIAAETDKLDRSVLFAKPAPEAAGEAKGENTLTALETLNLSRKATAPTPQLEDTFFTEAELDTTQARNDLLARLGQPLNGALPVNASGALAKGLGPDGKPQIGVSQAHTTAKSALKASDPQIGLPGLTSLTTSGATAAQELGHRPAEVQRQQIMERIVENARWVIRNNRNEVTFKLQPENLGEIHLKVVETNGMLKVDMTVESLAVKRMVESQLDDLQFRLQEENLTSHEFSFNVDVRQGDDSKQSEGFALRSDASARESGMDLADAANPNRTFDRSRPVWGQAGSGIYA